MQQRIRHLNLQVKAISIVLLVVLAVLAMMGATTIVRMNQFIAREHRRSVESMAASLAHACELPLIVKDRPELKRLCGPFVADPAVLFCAVQDERGELLAIVASDPQAWASFRAGAYGDDFIIARRDVHHTAESDEFDVFGSGVDGASEQAVSGRVGSVIIGLSNEPMHAAQAGQARTTILVGLGAAAASMLIAALVVRRWTYRIVRLSQALSRVSNGDYEFKLDDCVGDEIGSLAEGFDAMRQAIRDRNLKLERFNDTLQQQVAERTQDLEAAKVAAEAASKAKSDFLANMSHEIRTPMTAILGYSEALLDPSLDAAARLDAINTIHRNGASLLAMINDILDISKIEAGQMAVERKPTSLRRVISEVMSLMHVRAHARGQRLTCAYADAIPEMIETDALRLRQILVNLVGNAIKFGGDGDIRIVARFEPSSDGGEARLRIDVIDRGIGMQPEHLERIFHPFTQADSTMSRRYGGTGLGLTISRTLAQMLGGDISVTSKLGAGSTFSLTIGAGVVDGVRFVEPGEAEQAPDPSGAPKLVETPRLKGRILLVEDGPDNQRLIGMILKRAGADVKIVENGRLGVDAALDARDAGDPFHLILMDMQMPVMDGYAATCLLRENGHNGPIVALTAHAMTGERERCLKAGCDDYATKPVRRDELVRLAAKWIDVDAQDDAARNAA